MKVFYFRCIMQIATELFDGLHQTANRGLTWALDLANQHQRRGVVDFARVILKMSLFYKTKLLQVISRHIARLARNFLSVRREMAVAA